MTPQEERELITELFHEERECKEDCDYVYKSLMCRITSGSDNCPHKYRKFNANCSQSMLKRMQEEKEQREQK